MATAISPLPQTGMTSWPLDAKRFVGLMTVAEYVVYERADKTNQRYEYTDGKVFTVAGASPEHNRIALNIAVELQNTIERNDLDCEAFGSDQKVFVRQDKYAYPDVCVVCGEGQFDFADALRNPGAIFEILSPSTESEDRTSKFSDYEQIDSLQHYLLIDQNRISVTHYTKEAGTSWQLSSEYTSIADSLNLSFGNITISLPLARIYRRVLSDTAILQQ